MEGKLIELGIAFLFGLAVGGFLRTPIRVVLSALALVLLSWLYLDPSAWKWVEAWLAWGEKALTSWVQTAASWVVWALQNPQALSPDRLLGLLSSVDLRYAFLAGLIGGARA